MTDTYRLDRNEQRLTLEGITYSASDLDRLEKEITGQASDFLQDLCGFLKEWFNESPTIKVQTSGSTGVPKELVVRKEQMTQSARLTCEYLGLRDGDTALLCMPLKYIAGKMVVVRTLVAGLDLIPRTPSGHPLADVTTPIRFAALIPMQVYNSLQVPEERDRLSAIGTLIIGGGSIDPSLEEEIRKLPNAVYSTYGMTETLSHIALRRLNGPDASPYYHPFPSVKLSLSEDGTLVIEAPLVSDERLVTNDVARILPDGSFTILGRRDNIVNSGGIKIQIEEVEEALRPHLDMAFAITSIPDPKFGEILVLLLENPVPTRDSLIRPHGTTPYGLMALPHTTLWDNAIREAIGNLPPYHRPKHILEVDAIPQTGSGKIDRAACRAFARNIISKTR